MRSIVRSVARSAVALLFVGFFAQAGAATPTMTDPLIGLRFAPDQVRFPTWPDSDVTRTKLGNERKWTFACAPSGDATVCIIAGHRTVQGEDGAHVLEPDFGAVVYRRGRLQQVLGVPDRMYDEKPIVSPAARQRLLKDAVARYSRAFGGAARFEAEIRTQGITRDALPAALLDALDSAAIAVPASPGAGSEAH